MPCSRSTSMSVYPLSFRSMTLAIVSSFLLITALSLRALWTSFDVANCLSYEIPTITYCSAVLLRFTPFSDTSFLASTRLALILRQLSSGCGAGRARHHAKRPSCWAHDPRAAAASCMQLCPGIGRAERPSPPQCTRDDWEQSCLQPFVVSRCRAAAMSQGTRRKPKRTRRPDR